MNSSKEGKEMQGKVKDSLKKKLHKRKVALNTTKVTLNHSKKVPSKRVYVEEKEEGEFLKENYNAFSIHDDEVK